MSDDLEIHQKYIKRALELAAKAEGVVEPNPLVGAVLVKDDKIIGEGYHEYFGGPHAEINAIESVKESVEGATLYITLEPCAHSGKTAPCVDVIIKSGIIKVVFSVRDPNPVTDGKGAAILKKANIETIEGIGEKKSRRLNAPFFKLHKEGLPYFIGKWAMTLDGKIAAKTGDSKWISSEDSRMFMHEFRQKMGAVMVGINTVLADDPRLLAREGSKHHPKRIILDSFARMPLDSRLIETIGQSEVYLVVSPSAPQEKVKQLYELGVKILEIEEIDGKINFIKLARNLTEKGINKILLEGGGELLASAFESDLIDETMVFVAPKIIGGKGAKCPVLGNGIEFMKDAIKLDGFQVKTIGDDILLFSRMRQA